MKLMFLPIKLPRLIIKMGEYPDLNRESSVPHTVALPIKPYPPLVKI